VLAGVVLSGVFFVGRVSRLNAITSQLSEDGRARTYQVVGQVFFASAGAFSDAIDLLEPVAHIVIDPTQAHFWDISAVGALDKVVLKARRRGIEVTVVGLNQASATLVERFGIHDKVEGLPVFPAH